MLPELERLLILQERDRKIRALKLEQKNAPAERKSLLEKLAASESSLESVRQRAKQIEVERKTLEIDADSRREQIARFKTQQFQTRKNEEFQALGNEIKRYETEIQRIEDKELELMEGAEVVKSDIAKAEAAFAETKQQIDRQIAILDQKLSAIAAQMDDLVADRARIAGEIDENLIDRYTRLLATKGEAVVPLEHEVCMGCHMKTTPQTVHQVRAEKGIVHCGQCGRILYRAD